ncbi:hypothetical protein ACP70R_019961 [Stipagrostis hirtigluma subsp. patula]
MDRAYRPCSRCGFFLLVPLFFLSLFHGESVATADALSSLPLDKEQEAIMMNLLSVVGNNRWNTTPNPCHWSGVNCSTSDSGSSMVVTNITLANYGLSNSSIFATICRLHNLLFLDLSRNSFTDLSGQFFPSSCSMKDGLRFLNLSSNQLAHPLSDLSGFKQLEILDLSTNSFTSANLSADLGSFAKLKSLNLSSNKFNGGVPTTMVDSLAELVLSGNQLNGPIPERLFAYGNLTVLDLSQNNLTGTVRDEFMSLAKLETLLLSGNKLSGEIPGSLSNVRTLSRFAANQNNFTGPIPSKITNHVRMLDLSYNYLSGTIPIDFLSYPELQTVDLTSNMLEGSIPGNLSQSLYRLRHGANRLGGNIPDSICDGGSLAFLELDNNQLTGNIPSALSKCRGLSLLNLASNQLQGPVPAAISSLDKLEVLKLQMNKLNGSIPVEFSDLAMLSTLNVSYNSFAGVIPSEIFRLYKLSILDLQGDNIGGAIPISISSSPFLIELNLGNNSLTGTIPPMPPSLSTALNLSDNHLSGPIPSNIYSLSELEILDLSYNNLSGEVPSSLGSLQSLRQLVLSYNNLSGSVPKFGQFVEVNISGNPYLSNVMGNNHDIPITIKKRHTVFIIIFAIAGALAGLCLLVISLSRRNYRVEDERLPAGEDVAQIVSSRPIVQTSAMEFLKANKWHITTFQALEFEGAAIPQELTEENLVGRGGSGHVYRVTYTNRYNGSTGVVAVKQIRNAGSPDKKMEREFESEANILGNVRHNNIVKLLCCISSAESKLLVYDYMDNGSLDNWLHGHALCAGHSTARAQSAQCVPLDWPSRLRVAIGAAQGLYYMHHECSPPIIHRDIKPSNILLDSGFRAKVADFGLARMLVRAGATETMSAVAGSFGYMAPECAYTRKVNEKVDVYGFGVVLLELTTGRKANDGGEQGCLAQWAGHHYRSGESIADAMDRCIRYAGYPREIETVFRLGVECTGNSPSSRPTMKDVLQVLLKCSKQTHQKSRAERGLEHEAAPLFLPQRGSHWK